MLCEHCTAVCCKYIALPMDRPTSPRDFNDIRWYLMHEDVSVFIEDGDWYVQFATRCRNLTLDNRCEIYETRPQICHEYKAGECDYESGPHDYQQLFTRPEHIDAYATAWKKKQRAKRSRTRRKSAARPKYVSA
ncbi:MAG: YkgJ family cysteine cluster protein [Planctomycetota bacterium]